MSRSPRAKKPTKAGFWTKDSRRIATAWAAIFGAAVLVGLLTWGIVTYVTPKPVPTTATATSPQLNEATITKLNQAIAVINQVYGKEGITATETASVAQINRLGSSMELRFGQGFEYYRPGTKAKQDVMMMPPPDQLLSTQPQILAASLVHEGTHAADWYAGLTKTTPGDLNAFLDEEVRANEVEMAFVIKGEKAGYQFVPKTPVEAQVLSQLLPDVAAYKADHAKWVQRIRAENTQVMKEKGAIQ